MGGSYIAKVPHQKMQKIFRDSVCLSSWVAVGQNTRPQVLARHPVLCQLQQFTRVMSCQLADVMDEVGARSSRRMLPCSGW